MAQHLNLDVYVAVNLLMNCFLLWTTGRLARVKLTPARLVAAAGAGVLYSLAFLLPEAGFLFSTSGKVLFSLVMVAIAFQPPSWGRLLGLAAAFFGVSFMTAGSTMALVFLGSVHPAYPVSWWFLPVASVIVMGAGGATVWHLRRAARTGPRTLVAEVYLGEKKGRLRGYLDTGNCLRDPFSGVPVMVVECMAISDLLPHDVACSLQREPIDALEDCSGSFIAERLRIIPYSTLSNPGGLLLGFRPDVLAIHAKGRTFVTRDVVIAVVPGDLGMGCCDCLIPPDLVSPEED